MGQLTRLKQGPAASPHRVCVVGGTRRQSLLLGAGGLTWGQLPVTGEVGVRMPPTDPFDTSAILSEMF